MHRRSERKFIRYAVVLAVTWGALLLSACGPPVRIIPSFEGRVVDGVTGSPIANAVVQLTYYKAQPSFGGDIGSKALIRFAATDADGRYRIPSSFFVHLLSYYGSIDLRVNHPFYETREFHWFSKEYQALKQGERQFNNYGQPAAVKGEYRDGAVRFDIPLLKLRDKFIYETVDPSAGVVMLRRDVNNAGIHNALQNEFVFEGDRYVINARKLGLAIDRKKIFDGWDEIARPFLNRADVRRALQSGKDRIDRALKRLDAGEKLNFD